VNADARNFRIMGPGETASNRLDAVFEATERVWMEPTEPYDVHLAQDGRVMEVLSEHLCEGWLEGYLLTGRHDLFSCYEAFVHIVDSMFNQHAKWLKVSRKLPWRRPIASLNYLLTSHVWRQDHNGFSHQDPGFVDLVANKKADIVRIYLAPDANTLLWITDHCLRTYDRINVIVAGKQPAPQWLTMEQAATHCDAGVGIWTWAGNEPENSEPDVVMACAGDVPTLETMAAVDLLRRELPELKVRVVNVVDLMALQPHDQHPHGISDKDFDGIFTSDKPVIFAYHGYPYLIHRLTYNQLHDVTQELTHHFGRLAHRIARRMDIECIVAEIRQLQFAFQQTAVCVRVGAHPSFAARRQILEFGNEAAGIVEQRLWTIAAHHSSSIARWAGLDSGSAIGT
jgi:xylulose-5-phosphate/fructose-6-phosphate phosphoketolase